MKLSCAITTPDVSREALAVFTGSFEQKLAKAKALGYDGVELMLRDPSKLNVDDIRSVLNRHGLPVSQIVSGEVFMSDSLALVHPDDAICEAALRRIQNIIQFAGALGRGTIVNIGRVRGRLDWLPVDKSVAHARMIKTLQTVVDYAASYGVRIALEPCNRYEVDFVQSTRDGLEAVAEVNRPNFGLMLDVFHMNIEDPSIEGAFREARAVLLHVHIADSNRLPPGSGHIDFASIVATLREIGYTGYLSVEARPLPDPDSAARQTIEFMSRFVPGARAAQK